MRLTFPIRTGVKLHSSQPSSFNLAQNNFQFLSMPPHPRCFQFMELDAVEQLRIQKSQRPIFEIQFPRQPIKQMRPPTGNPFNLSRLIHQALNCNSRRLCRRGRHHEFIHSATFQYADHTSRRIVFHPSRAAIVPPDMDMSIRNHRCNISNLRLCASSTTS